jgi:hypothetical protein
MKHPNITAFEEKTGLKTTIPKNHENVLIVFSPTGIMLFALSLKGLIEDNFVSGYTMFDKYNGKDCCLKGNY